MIGALTGIVYTSDRNPIILSVGGVGYRVHVPPKLIGQIKPDSKLSLMTHMAVREDAIELYGFSNNQELNLFELLLTVSGIGPRTALSVVDRGGAAVEHAVANSDVDFFTTIPRLGKKNAQKIIIELKSKLGSVKELDLTGESTGETREILEALLAMGFDRKEALYAIKKLDNTDPIEKKIRSALKLLGKT